MKRSQFLQQIRRLFFASQLDQSGDADLLAQFCNRRDEDAFATLVQRHGPLVWRVCRRMLRDEHLAEDVFQATFLVLSKRAASIHRPDALAGWLHGVATRLALKARLRESKRKTVGDVVEEPAAPDGVEEMTVRELRAVLDAELLHLPDKYRYPLVLCYLEGKTRDEAAQQLACPLETLKSRLERGRELLQGRLVRRQLAFNTALLSLLVAEGAVQAGPPADLALGTAGAAARYGSELFVAGEVSQRALALAQGSIAGMKLAKVKGAAVAVLLVGLLATTGLWLARGLGMQSPAAPAVGSTDVFEGPPAPFVPRLRANLPAADGPLRRLLVEERVGVQRSRELVRVPLFFHEGECSDPHGLQLLGSDQQVIAYQPDDIRRAEDGSVSRMHIYFPVELAPWQRHQYVLVKGENPGRKEAAVPLRRDNGSVTLAGNDLQLRFHAEGERAGAIAGIGSSIAPITVPEENLGPRLQLQRQAADLHVTRMSEVSYAKPESLQVREVRYGSGPHFAKLVVRFGPPGVPDLAEVTYLVPRHGHYFVQTQRLFPEEGDSTDVVGAAGNDLLAGRLVLGNDQRVVAAPSGLRRLTRSTQGQTNHALVSPQAGLSILAVPNVQLQRPTVALEGDAVAFRGSGDFRRSAGAGSDDLRAFWGQMRYVLSGALTEEDLWSIGRAHVQPLVAVVEEPGVATDDLHQRLQALMKQFGYTHSRSWMQEAGRLYTLGDGPALQKLLATGPGAEPLDTTKYWIDSARKARDEITKNGTVPLAEADKGKAAGALDPWNLTYAATPLVALSAQVQPTARLDDIALAIGTAQRQAHGRVDAFGMPYIDCYNTNQNMQLGSVLAGLHGGRKAGHLDLVQFYRDVARNPQGLDLYGHAQRSNRIVPGPGEGSDFLHENNSDFFLRAAELACNEDLWLHPAVFGRYFDGIDVNADLCHRTVVAGKKPPSWYRANYWRGQAHDRRWEVWAAAPFLGLLGRGADRGSVGLTEACYYANHLHGQNVNWTEITTLFHADLALRETLARYRPEAGPALPAQVAVDRGGTGNRVHWQAAGGNILGYRVYRAERLGGPWTLLNSPYAQPSGALVGGTEYTDPAGKPQHVYWVTSVDAQRRESRWFPGERREE